MNNKKIIISIIILMIFIIGVLAILILLNSKKEENVLDNNIIIDDRYTVDRSKQKLDEKYTKFNEKNQSNELQIQATTEERLLNKYLEDYKKNALYFPEDAYNLLDEIYRNKRFGNLNEFKRYLEDCTTELNNLELYKYLINDYNTYKEFVCIDQYDNYYIFKVTNPGDYTVTLDTYTVDSEKFIKEYNSGNESKKVQLNIDKFIKMINAKDYKNSYALLYDEFKNNYFKTEDVYKQYIKNNLFEYNTVTYDKFSNEGDTYIYELTVSDKTGTISGTKKLTIIMKLKQGTDFVMSFSIV